MKLIQNKTKTLQDQVDTIIGDVVKLNIVIDMQKDHTRAISHVNKGIEHMMAHTNLSYSQN